jgi:hypothetical protein
MKRKASVAPLGRAPYAALGVVLTLLKFGVDALVAHHYGRDFTWLNYVDPTTAPLFRHGEMPAYWSMLAYTTAPFVALGVYLTLRRLRDAGASPWLVFFFFVPFANLLFFVATALLPPTRTSLVTTAKASEPFRAQDSPIVIPGKPRGPMAAVLYAAALGSVAALGAFGVSVGLLGRYGYGLALGTPFIAGFVAGAALPRLLPSARFVDAFLATVFTLVISVGLVIVFALEGLGCLVVFLPLLILPAGLGAAMGFAVGREFPPREHSVSITAGMLLLGLTFVAEAAVPAPPDAAPMVETRLAIDAPPAVVWPLVVAVDEMPPPTEFPFLAGISYPMHATLDAARVGAIRRCTFNTGDALETVTTWEPPHRLVFTIDRQPDPLRELTLYRSVRQPHLDGAVRNRVGEFELLPLDGGARTLLVGRSWYETSLRPAVYWEAYAESIIHTIHRRVMTTVKRRAEAADHGVASAR